MTAKERVLAVHPKAYAHKYGMLVGPDGPRYFSYQIFSPDIALSSGFYEEEAAWQDAADSLPGAPEHCPNCNHKAHYALRCGALIATGSDGEFAEEVRCECLNWVAEPKPTPSTTPESHQMWCNISLSAWPLICTCVKPQPDSSSIPDQKPWLDQAVDLLNLYQSGYCPKDVAKDFLEKCKLNFGNVAEYEPLVDSSSISTEQTFKEWWRGYHPRFGVSGEGYEGVAEAAWNAAKGQSNGR